MFECITPFNPHHRLREDWHPCFMGEVTKPESLLHTHGAHGKAWDLDEGQTVTGSGVLMMFSEWLLTFGSDVTVDVHSEFCYLHGWAPILQTETPRPTNDQAPKSNYLVERKTEWVGLLGGCRQCISASQTAQCVNLTRLFFFFTIQYIHYWPSYGGGGESMQN